MSKGLIFGIGLVVGAAAGSVGTYFLVKDKIRKEEQMRADAEISDAKAAMQRHKTIVYRDLDEDTEDVETETPMEQLNKKVKVTKKSSDMAKKLVAEIIARENYAADEEEQELDPNTIDIYVITPEEFQSEQSGDMGYENIYIYEDGVIATIDDVPIDEGTFLSLVGPDALDNIGKYETNTVHVRNEARNMEYEIYATNETFRDHIANEQSTT